MTVHDGIDPRCHGTAPATEGAVDENPGRSRDVSNQAGKGLEIAGSAVEHGMAVVVELARQSDDGIKLCCQIDNYIEVCRVSADSSPRTDPKSWAYPHGSLWAPNRGYDLGQILEQHDQQLRA